MGINPVIVSKFKDANLNRSESGKTILKYDTSKTANQLFNFIMSHPSIRVAFNSMVKADFVSLEKGLTHLTGLLTCAKTSLVFEAHCTGCNNIIDKPHVYHLFDDDATKIKHITCSNCKKINILGTSCYKPCPNVDLKDLLKALYRGDNTIFSIVPVKECFECGHQSIETSPAGRLRIHCHECGSLAYISMQVFPYGELKDLIANKQGYWLEWFIWRLLREKYSTEVGLMIERKDNKYETDVLVINNNKRILIECKDGSDTTFVNKLHEIKKDCDYYILISTSTVNNNSVNTAKRILKNKFIHVTSDKIENISEIISSL